MTTTPRGPTTRRPRYAGKNPRRFDQRYKELDPARYPDVHEHVRAKGDTPAGTHVPVMVAEVLEALDPRPGQTVADATLGHGGHALEFWSRVAPDGRVIGFDVDGKQLTRTAARLTEAGVRLTAVHGNFAGLDRALGREGLVGVDVVFADLGVSSMQIDDPARGFSYNHDGPLDMRMDRRLKQTAADLLATMSEPELVEALTDLGDEPYAERIAHRLVGERRGHAIKGTRQLVGLVLDAVGLSLRDFQERRRAGTLPLHPAARTFQVLRMLVNDELGSLRHLLRIIPSILVPGGRVGILSFHSGEDRLVKHAFRDGLVGGTYDAISEDVIRPSPEERRSNPRSGSTKFRWARRAP